MSTFATGMLAYTGSEDGIDSLKVVWLLLPRSVALNANLDASEDHLLTTTKIYA